MLALLLLACTSAEPQVRALAGEALGTTWSVKWLEPADASEEEVRAAVVETLDEVDAAMSTWRDDSELSRARAAGGPIPISEDTFLVVDAALDLAAATGGAFDPTVQPLMELWGFHGAAPATPPTEAEIEAARARVGWQRVRLARTDGQPTLDVAGTALDLSAIAKGHAVDRVSHALSDLALPDHMVEVGGEVRAHGRGPSGPTWVLGVDLPVVGAAPGAELAAVVRLTNRSMATSGNYRNTLRPGVHHTMDPRTGRPAVGEVASATVVAADCRTADGLATALMVLSLEEGRALVGSRPDVEALWIVPDPGGLRTVATPGFQRHLLPSDENPSGD